MEAITFTLIKGKQVKEFVECPNLKELNNALREYNLRIEVQFVNEKLFKL